MLKITPVHLSENQLGKSNVKDYTSSLIRKPTRGNKMLKITPVHLSENQLGKSNVKDYTSSLIRKPTRQIKC